MSQQHTEWENYGTADYEADFVLNESLNDGDGDANMGGYRNTGYGNTRSVIPSYQFIPPRPQGLNSPHPAAAQLTTATPQTFNTEYFNISQFVTASPLSVETTEPLIFNPSTVNNTPINAQSFNTGYVAPDQLTTPPDFDSIPETPLFLGALPAVNPYNVILQNPRVAHFFNHGLTSEELEYARTLQQNSQRQEMATTSPAFTYPDPELYSMDYNDELQNTAESGQSSSSYTPALFSEQAYPTREEIARCLYPDFNQAASSVATPALSNSNAAHAPLLGVRVVTYLFLRPSDVDVDGVGSWANRQPSQIQIPPRRPSWMQQQQMPPPPPPTLQQQHQHQRQRQRQQVSPLSPPPSPPQQHQQQQHQHQPHQLPDTYAQRRSRDARKRYPWECSVCGHRFLYIDSATKHARKDHATQGWRIIKRFEAPKRPPPAQPRNSKNAEAQEKRKNRK